jgi:hypothetical protein
MIEARCSVVKPPEFRMQIDGQGRRVRLVIVKQPLIRFGAIIYSGHARMNLGSANLV